MKEQAVLFSGGWDSAACALLYPDADLVFFNYGQIYHAKELRAAKAFAESEGRDLYYKTVNLEHDIERRNFYLISQIKLIGYKSVVVGSRNIHPLLDKYKDSNWWSIKQFGKLMNIETRMPMTLWSRRAVVNFVKKFYAGHMYNCYFSASDCFKCECSNCLQMRKLL